MTTKASIFIFSMMAFTYSYFIKSTVTSFQFYSQYGQDQFVYNQFFINKPSGIFVEVGAHDGVEHSNTYFFEKSLGWRGICIEPRAIAFAALQKNRNCYCVQTALANQSGTRKFLEVVGPSQELSGLVNSYHPDHLARVQREVKGRGGCTKTYAINCITLNQLCTDFGFNKIDFLSIDTEGSELEILRSIDFVKLQVSIITVENNRKDPQIKKLLKRVGFRLFRRIKIDEIYVSRSFMRAK